MDRVRGRWAQRLWLLERADDDAADAWRDVCRFTGAIAILSNGAIHVLFLRSADPNGATAARLGRPGVRWDLERDATPFPTLEEAVAWANEKKRGWQRRGWLEVESDPSEPQRCAIPGAHR